jgi:adenosylcobinamide kinase/adenosylcobinamide-phosphate guanylyltransferase
MAVGLAKKLAKRIAYIATAPACDEEMRLRIEKHKRSRPRNWLTVETGGRLVPRIKAIPKSVDGVIIECIATYVSNLIMAGLSDAGINKDLRTALSLLKKPNREIFIVSNEVGSGVVPDSETGRRFRDVVGTINQVLAQEANEVYLVAAGLPVRLK